MPISINQCGQYILGDREVLDNVLRYMQNSGKTHQIEMLVDYLAAGIQWHPDEVRGYFKSKLK